ncbi:hypothetical protein ACROYT_G003853 [Oculina patagonica]
MFANFTPRIQQIKLTREQLEASVNSLIETRNDLRRFLDDECATAREWQDFETVSERVDQLNVSALQLTERANSKLQIAFIGSVGAGKSTLINALLGEDIMPVTRAETTFCSVAVTGSSGSQWTAVERSTGRALEISEFRQLLHVLKAREQRERLGITPSSIIDVKWPSARCKALVESVVLYDTPGIGERKATDDAVIELCKFVDVIVAVMDIHSPTLRTVVDFVKAVNCRYTLGVFTKWDMFQGNNFSEEYGDTTVDDVKDRCGVEFMSAVSDRGKVYFIDSQTQMEARNHPSNQNEASSTTSETTETEGFQGFKEFERDLVEAAKGALKFDTLKYDLERFIAEAKALSGNLSRIMENRKQQRIQRLSRRMNKVMDAENNINLHLSQISNALLDVMKRLQRDQQLSTFKMQIEQDMRNGVSPENAMNRCRDGLNQRLQVMVEKDRTLKNQLDAIWNCLSQVADGPARLSLQVSQPTWRSEDFQLDESFDYQGNDLRARLANPSLPARMLCYGLLGASVLGPNGGLFSAIGGPVLNSILPSTDFREWLRYFWPTSDAEVKAVQDFFVAKVRGLHEEKCEEVAVDGISDVKTTAEVRIRGVKRSLEDDIKNVQGGDNFLNKRRRITDRLQNSFEAFEERAHDI